MPCATPARLALAGAFVCAAGALVLGCAGGSSTPTCDGTETVLYVSTFQVVSHVPTYSAVEVLPAAIEVGRIQRARLTYKADNLVPTLTSSVEIVAAPEPRQDLDPTVVDRVSASGFPFPAVSRGVDVTEALTAILAQSRSFRLGGRMESELAVGDVECREVRLTICYTPTSPEAAGAL